MMTAELASHAGTRQYFGKYRGTVLSNIDPQNRGRLLVSVPDVLGLAPSTWALPCAPLAGLQNGFYALPVIGSAVWVEFEQGDADFPIWVGCFWGSAAEVPNMARVVPPLVPGITLQTPLQNGLTISDLPGPTGGLLLKCGTGAFIAVNDAGIFIQNGKGASLTLVGPTVDVNQGALSVV